MITRDTDRQTMRQPRPVVYRNADGDTAELIPVGGINRAIVVRIRHLAPQQPVVLLGPGGVYARSAYAQDFGVDPLDEAETELAQAVPPTPARRDPALDEASAAQRMLFLAALIAFIVMAAALCVVVAAVRLFA
jgi:hypothetical protein